MVMATKFYLCPTCGNVVYKFFDSGVGVDCCGGKMQEIVPHTNDMAMEKHLPVVECCKCGTIKVKVGSKPHPMTPEHYISFIFLETDHGGQIKYLSPGEAPEAVFHICKEKPVAVYEYCTIHGLWKTEIGTKCRKRSLKNLFGIMAAALVCLIPMSCAGQKVNNTPVKSLDLGRYLGDWYEIARFDHSFERGMNYAKANYTLGEDGAVIVRNSGIKNGKYKTSIGRAVLTDTDALLRVSFFGPFYSDYRVMMLSDDYNYALVGSKSPKYLWILSRLPKVPDEILKQILAEAASRGYCTDKLIWVKQSVDR